MRIVDGLWMVDGLRASHVYIVASDGAAVIVDTGIRGSHAAILAELRAAGFDPHEVRAIVVTHAHLDHIGSLPELQQATGAPALAPPVEADAVEGTAALPAPPGMHGAPMRAVNARFRPEPVPVERRLDLDAPLPEIAGCYTIATPGHTPGHVSFYNRDGRWLIAGDALANLGGVRASPWLFSSEPSRALASAALLAGLPLRTAVFGHGAPIVDDPRLGMEIARVAARR